MKTLETTLLEDFGPVDRRQIRSGLLAERGINAVFDGPGDHSLTVEYDPTLVAGERLLEILCRNGVCPGAVAPPADAVGRERWLDQLRDGRRVLVRPIRSSDVERNARFIERLSPPSKHFLFLGGIAQLSELALRRLCDTDYAHEMAYIALALDPKSGETRDQVGVCRYARAEPTKGAEISVAVADAWQHLGLGRILLRHLIDYARTHGVSRLYSLDTVANTRMRALARDVGFTADTNPDDASEVVYSLDLQRNRSARSGFSGR